MDVDYGSLSNVLKNPTRRKIILVLSTAKCLLYLELMNQAEVSHTGKFNYHLKTLGDLIQKDKDGKYCLTEKGILAADFIQKFPDKKPMEKSLRMSDAALIGFAGIVATAANPMFILGAFLAIMKGTVPLWSISVISVAGELYGLLVPGALMWVLSVRRAHSHEKYDLLKPPLIAFLLSLVFILIMVLAKFNIVATISAPPISISQYGISHISTGTSLMACLGRGLALSFVGVGIAEAACRIKQKML